MHLSVLFSTLAAFLSYSNKIGQPELGINTLEQKEDGKERLTAQRQYMQRKNI
jgi:hypothetical protein